MLDRDGNEVDTAKIAELGTKLNELVQNYEHNAILHAFAFILRFMRDDAPVEGREVVTAHILDTIQAVLAMQKEEHPNP